MKIRLFSDIHLEHRENGPGFDLGSGEVLILAGDILTAKHLKKNGPLKKTYLKFFKDCSKNYDHVIFIAGNHEHYGYHYNSTQKAIEENIPKNFNYLQNSKIRINDTYFLGATLWTDFRKENPLSMMDAGSTMNDYKAIRINNNYRKLNPDDTLSFHKESLKYLDDTMEELKGEKIVVITHHVPSLRSIPTRFRTYDYGAYCSDLEWLMEKHSYVLHCHGHTHSHFDYVVDNTRVVCNPLGYLGEETGFDVNFEIEI